MLLYRNAGSNSTWTQTAANSAYTVRLPPHRKTAKSVFKTYILLVQEKLSPHPVGDDWNVKPGLFYEPFNQHPDEESPGRKLKL